MRVNYKVVGLIPMVWIMSGCIFHRNVIESIDRTKVEIRDTRTNERRTILRDTTKTPTECSEYTYIGDTVYVKSAKYKDKVLQQKNTSMYVNCDSIFARQCRDTIAKQR